MLIYVIGFILFGMFASYKFGRADESLQHEIASPLVVFVIMWPILLPALVIAVPFFVMYSIGVRVKNKKKEVK